MKILFIGSQRFDYLQDLTYTGLVKTLGIKNVHTAVWNKKYHVPYIYQYPKNIGYTPKSLCKSLINRFANFQYDAVVVASAKPDTFSTYEVMQDTIAPHIPIIFIDGGDREAVGGDLERLKCDLYDKVTRKRPFDLIFKREYLVDTEYESHIKPFPFSVNFEKIPNVKKNNYLYDVSFWAGENHPDRTTVLNALEGIFDCEKNGTGRNLDFKSFKRKGTFYLEELSKCKISLNARGGGWDTLRYWEIPAVGSMMLSQKPGIVIPHNFVDKESVVFLNNDLSNVEELASYYLKHEKEREKIAKKGYNWLGKYHTDIKRAETILNLLR